MKHLVEAYRNMKPEAQHFIKLSEQDHSVTFVIQDGPIKEVGENGCQAADMLDYCRQLFKSLDRAFPSDFNIETIRNIEFAIEAQIARTQDREARGVEGLNKD